MVKLKVPYALTNKNELTNALAARSFQAPFSCPARDSNVTLKRGEVRVAHFAHASDTACTQESIEHATAKLRLSAYLDALANRERRGLQLTLSARVVEIF